MGNEFMPEGLHAATADLVTETVERLQEVLLYSQITAEEEWPRMLLYRITDAQDTLDMLVGLYAAQAFRAGCDPDVLKRYMQTSQECPRTQKPRQEDIDYLDGLIGRPPGKVRSGRYQSGQIQREHPGDSDLSDRHRDWTLACIHALQAFACAAPDALEDLPADIGSKAKRVYATVIQDGSQPDPTSVPAAEPPPPNGSSPS
ncbi:hypothetical protein ACFOY4_30915 [Actinomadura syzygii]|uniref:Uncharacterized protein n=1 Tax=Actinomadura syzygii TaxID=1427538 RepID=A0A5D0TQY8_9ACTN|nr:hypothetical protein [Actinomadura syzygii]TYC08731.1 hypothetical protein FXF65_38310 [Actinomadura syzygii]